MPTTLHLVDRAPITYKSAADQEQNFVNQAAYVADKERLYRQLWDRRDTIAAVVRHHLSLGPAQTCTVGPQGQWIRGSFNVCIPVDVELKPISRQQQKQKLKLILRCPLPFKLAEAKHPGTVDEKLACEVGTYAWMQEQCPDVRIPHLYGFGFSEMRQVRLLCLPIILNQPSSTS